MSESRLQELYRQAMSGRDPAAPCVSPEALLALVRREGPEPERLQTLDHVMSCPACGREYELLRALESAGAATAPGSSVRSIRRWAGALALAASILVAVGVGLKVRSGNRTEDATRGTTHGVVLLAPPTEMAPGRAIRFVWRSVAGAQRYRMELLDRTGTAVYSQVTADTALSLPANRLRPGGTYKWWVRDATPGAQLASELRLLRIRNK
jgi:hypothetical protein